MGTTDAVVAGNSIGFLRLLLASIVVYGHSWYLAGHRGEPLSRILLGDTMPIAGLGVRGFFFLSGFLLYQSERRTSSTRDFLWNRALRIYPGLWACLLVTGLLLPGIARLRDPQLHIATSDMWSYVYRNAGLPRFQLAIDGLFAEVPRPGDLNGSLWTLPYEVGCYIVLAAFGWIGATQPGTRWPVVIGLLLLGIFAWDVYHPTSTLFFSTDGRALCIWFAAGALCSHFRDSLRPRLNGVTVAAALALWLASTRLGASTLLLGPFALGAGLLWFTWRLPLRGFELKVGGDYSYGLYIYAYPVQQMLAALGLHQRGIALYFVCSLTVALVLAIASWHLVEKRALRFKQGAERKPSAGFPRQLAPSPSSGGLP